MVFRRSILSLFALAFSLTGCGSGLVNVKQTRGPVGIRTQDLNVQAAGNEAIALRLRQTFIWLAASKPENSPKLRGSSGAVVTAPALSATAAASSLPPDWVCQHESNCTYGLNTGNGYFGKWQFSFAWAGKLGLPADITQATPAQEDEAARQLWANGAGCGNWSGPNWSACG